jgi:hypothetical protein
MRPTLLNFRSPKERTPFSFYSRQTYDGRSLSFCSPKGSGKTSTFNNEKRFNWYRSLKGTSYPVGPGSYSPSVTRKGKFKITSIVPYKKLYGLNNQNCEGYEMVGDQIVPDHEFLMKTHKRTHFGSDPKLSTKQNTSNDSQTSTFSKRMTPDPILSRHKVSKPQNSTRSRTGTQKNFKVVRKLEKILKSRVYR